MPSTVLREPRGRPARLPGIECCTDGSGAEYCAEIDGQLWQMMDDVPRDDFVPSGAHDVGARWSEEKRRRPGARGSVRGGAPWAQKQPWYTRPTDKEYDRGFAVALSRYEGLEGQHPLTVRASCVLVALSATEHTLAPYGGAAAVAEFLHEEKCGDHIELAPFICRDIQRWTGAPHCSGADHAVPGAPIGRIIDRPALLERARAVYEIIERLPDAAFPDTQFLWCASFAMDVLTMPYAGAVRVAVTSPSEERRIRKVWGNYVLYRILEEQENSAESREGGIPCDNSWLLDAFPAIEVLRHNVIWIAVMEATQA